MVRRCLIVLLLFITYFESTYCSASAENTDNNGYNPIETQRAECTLISGDVRASAEASVSRKLEGFCGTEHLSRAFGNLEYRLLNEINHLKVMINMLLPPMYQQHYFAQPQPNLYQPLPTPSTNSTNIVKSTQVAQTPEKNSQISESNTNNVPNSPQSDEIQNESPFAVATPATSTDTSAQKEVTTIEESAEAIVFPTERLLEFRPVQKKPHERNKPSQKTKTGPREFEINKLNNTIQIGVDLQIFTYYWKIEHFSEKLKSNISTINSPIFSISGLFLRVTATLNHLGRDYLHLQLEQVTSGKGTDKSNIILKTGDLFKKIQTKVEFKHKIAILDQVTPTSDLVSQEFANTNQGFLVPNSAILSGPYSKGDILLIKIVMNL